MGIRYATREQVKAASEIKSTANLDAVVDAAIEAASRSVESLTHRKFYPTTGTRYFDWPNSQYARSWRLWLGPDEVISVTSLVSGGVTISSSNFFLEPVNLGPPYTCIELNRASSAAFGNGATPQRDIAVTGVFGYSADTTSAGTVATTINSSATTLEVTNGAPIGVGDLLGIESERLQVTERAFLTSGLTLSGNVASSNAAVSLTLSSSGISKGEVLLIDSERMHVLDVVGSVVVVQRAYDGSVLASHSSGATVYASRSLTVSRAQTGTAAASHNSSTAIVRYVPPGPVVALTIAEALETVSQEQAAYGRTDKTAVTENSSRGYIGTGYQTGFGLQGLRMAVRESHGRQLRMAAV